MKLHAVMLLVLAGCTRGGSPAPTTVSHAEPGQASTSAPRPGIAISAFEGRFSAVVEGTMLDGPPKVQEAADAGGVAGFALPLGGEQPAQCYVMRKRANLSTMFGAAMKIGAAAVEQEAPVPSLHRASVTHEGCRLVARTVVGLEGGSHGEATLKVAAASGPVDLFCVHPGPGHAEVFERATTSLFRTSTLTGSKRIEVELWRDDAHTPQYWLESVTEPVEDEPVEARVSWQAQRVGQRWVIQETETQVWLDAAQRLESGMVWTWEIPVDQDGRGHEGIGFGLQDTSAASSAAATREYLLRGNVKGLPSESSIRVTSLTARSTHRDELERLALEQQDGPVTWTELGGARGRTVDVIRKCTASRTRSHVLQVRCEDSEETWYYDENARLERIVVSDSRGVPNTRTRICTVRA